MRKKIELAVLLLFLAVLVLLSKNLQKLVSSGNVTAKNKIIVLDSGHGGDDPGKIGVNQAKEKDVNLEIARKIKKRLEKKGWEVVKASGCENAMLILDTWHWVRANQPYDILTPEIAKKVISIQINDAYERPYADSILRDESMHDRLAPGTGAKDTAGFVKMIKDAGIDPKVVGVEVISDEILGRGINEAAAYTYENTEKVLKEAWPELVD